jgi:hypothetical protein
MAAKTRTMPVFIVVIYKVAVALRNITILRWNEKEENCPGSEPGVCCEDLMAA